MGYPLISKVIIIIFQERDRANPTLAPLLVPPPLPVLLPPPVSRLVASIHFDGPPAFLHVPTGHRITLFFSSFLRNFNLPAVGTCDLLSSDSDLGPNGARFSARPVAVVVTEGGGWGLGRITGDARLRDATLKRKRASEAQER